MRSFFGVLLIYIRAGLRTEFQYRSAWWVHMVGFILGYGTQFILMGVLVNAFGTLNGWGPYEVMLLYALAVCSYTIAQSFSGTFFWEVHEKIHSGEFDHTLTRPMNPMLYEISVGFSAYYFWHFLISLFMVGICVVNLDIELGFIKILTFFGLMIGAAMVQAGIVIIFSTASFWLVGENPLSQMYMRLREMAEYPLSIYPAAIQVFLTVILPFGFIAFYPAQYFLSKSDYLMFGPWIQFGGPAVGVVTLALAACIWHYGANRYSSSGS